MKAFRKNQRPVRVGQNEDLTEISTTRIELTVEREVLSVVSMQRSQADSPSPDALVHPLLRRLAKSRLRTPKNEV